MAQVVILAAGKGTRMRSSRPKVLQPLCGRAMIEWVLDQALAQEPSRIVLVVGHGADEVERLARAAAGDVPLECVVQEPQLGTGHALHVAAPALDPGTDCVVVQYGDMPLLSAASFARLLDARAAAGAGAAALLTAEVDDPTGYGRVLRGADGAFRAIVEHADATDEQRGVREVNLGVYAFPTRDLLAALPRLTSDNAQGEFYITDLVGLLAAAGGAVTAVRLADPDEARGVNDFEQLAAARSRLQRRILALHMRAGVFIEDPETTYIGHGVSIGPGTRILPCTYVQSGVVIGAGCEVGPFTQLRAGTVLEDGAEVGNFTECKNATVGPGAKAKHLSYLGDVVIGARANIGAGTIFANYDGKEKHASIVGERAFVGSGTIVVAPNEIGSGAVTGAGAVVTRGANVAPGETWFGVPARRFEPKSKEDPERER